MDIAEGHPLLTSDERYAEEETHSQTINYIEFHEVMKFPAKHFAQMTFCPIRYVKLINTNTACKYLLKISKITLVQRFKESYCILPTVNRYILSSERSNIYLNRV